MRERKKPTCPKRKKVMEGIRIRDGVKLSDLLRFLDKKGIDPNEAWIVFRSHDPVEYDKLFVVNGEEKVVVNNNKNVGKLIRRFSKDAVVMVDLITEAKSLWLDYLVWEDEEIFNAKMKKYKKKFEKWENWSRQYK